MGIPAAVRQITINPSKFLFLYATPQGRKMLESPLFYAFYMKEMDYIQVSVPFSEGERV